MTKYLILVKHSVPEIEEGRHASAWPLSKEGQFRAHQLALELERYVPEAIFSSPEPKALETAEILARHFELELETVPGLREHDRSKVPYLPHEAFQDSLRTFFQYPDERVFGRETADEAHARFYRAVHSILNEHNHKTVLVVSHGTVISLFVARLTGGSDVELWSKLGLPSFVALDLNSSTVIVRSTIV
jgi:broad specificity phosphatase PhoE